MTHRSLSMTSWMAAASVSLGTICVHTEAFGGAHFIWQDESIRQWTFVKGPTNATAFSFVDSQNASSSAVSIPNGDNEARRFGKAETDMSEITKHGRLGRFRGHAHTEAGYSFDIGSGPSDPWDNSASTSLAVLQYRQKFRVDDGDNMLGESHSGEGASWARFKGNAKVYDRWFLGALDDGVTGKYITRADVINQTLPGFRASSGAAGFNAADIDLTNVSNQINNLVTLLPNATTTQHQNLVDTSVSIVSTVEGLLDSLTDQSVELNPESTGPDERRSGVVYTEGHEYTVAIDIYAFVSREGNAWGVWNPLESEGLLSKMPWQSGVELTVPTPASAIILIGAGLLAPARRRCNCQSEPA